jgi:hypothetical protein
VLAEKIHDNRFRDTAPQPLNDDPPRIWNGRRPELAQRLTVVLAQTGTFWKPVGYALAEVCARPLSSAGRRPCLTALRIGLGTCSAIDW